MYQDNQGVPGLFRVVDQGIMIMADTGQIGALIRRHRVRRGLTQQELANLSKLSVRAIRDLESGRTKKPRRESVRLLSRALGISQQDILDAIADAGMTEWNETRSPLPSVLPSMGIGDPFVGREAELLGLTGLFLRDNRRLVTMTGVCGVGKSRLALEVSRNLHFRDRVSVLWVGSSGTVAGNRTSSSIPGFANLKMHQLLMDNGDGRLAELVGEQNTLLVIDNFDAESMSLERAARLLHRWSRLRILVSSRVPVYATEQPPFPVDPLPVASTDEDFGTSFEDLAELPSVRLFAAFLREIHPTFTLDTWNVAMIARLCWSLDGLPGALKRAAQWTTVYSLGHLADQLAEDPLFLVHPPNSSHCDWDVARKDHEQTLGRLTIQQRFFLFQVGRLERSWSIRETASLFGRTIAETAFHTHALLRYGFFRRIRNIDGWRFEMLNLSRLALREFQLRNGLCDAWQPAPVNCP
jgi:transcriptional regulator with XRE-family HTH domain